MPGLRFRSKKADALEAARITLRAIRDSSEAFPPLKSVVAATLIVWDTSKVIFVNFFGRILLRLASESEVKQEGEQAVSKSSGRDRTWNLAADEGLRRRGATGSAT
jgi:hypothetical protein